jgi:ribosome-binding factor A
VSAAVRLVGMQVAKVYVSVYSDQAGKERAMTNLKRVAP